MKESPKMPDILNPLTGRRYPRSKGRTITTVLEPGAPPEAAEPVDSFVPEDLAPFWPREETADERTFLVAAERRLRHPVGAPGEVLPMREVMPQELARERHAYRRRTAEAAKARAERSAAGAAARNAAATCPSCLQPAMAVTTIGESSYRPAASTSRRLPVLGAFICCDACYALHEVKAVELLRAQQLERGTRGALVDVHVDRLLAQKRGGA